MANNDKRASGINRGIRSCIKTIDEKTDDLLKIADVLEEHQINVKLANGRYLNPASAIRTKVSVIWNEVQMIACEVDKEVSGE